MTDRATVEITKIRFEIRNQVRNQKSAVISRAWKSQKSGLKSVEIRNQLEIKLILKFRTRFQQVSDPSLDSYLVMAHNHYSYQINTYQINTELKCTLTLKFSKTNVQVMLYLTVHCSFSWNIAATSRT